MKHRRVVGGPKKKNRIQEVNASNEQDGATSPLESPNLGASEEQNGVAAVQRFLTNRRNRRMEDNVGGGGGGNGSSSIRKNSGSFHGSSGTEYSGSSPNDDDEPDNDSGDEGLKRRRNFLLAGGTILPTALPPTSSLPPLPTTSPPLPAVKSSEDFSKEQTTQAAAAAAAKTPLTSNTKGTHTSSHSHVHPLLAAPAPSSDAAVHPLLATSNSSAPPPSLDGPTSSPHHRPRAPSVSFSMQTTDLESGQPWLPISNPAPLTANDPPPHLSSSEHTTNTTTTSEHASSTTTTNNNNNNNTTSSDNFFAMFMHRNEKMMDDDQHVATNNESTPLLTEARDGSIRPGGIVDLTRATALSTDDGDLEDGSFHSEADSTVGGKDTTNEESQTAAGGQSILEQLFEEGTQAVYDSIAEATSEAWEQYDESCHYDWREFWKGGGALKFIRWLATGMAPENYKQSDDEVQDNLNSLARMLSLLREYNERFGMPEIGGGKDQEYVLREVTKDLYLGGSPIWALEPVMKRVAEGLTGKRGVDFFMLPRRAFIFAPSSGATAMFQIIRGYDMQRLDDMESVAVRLASFASNTSSVASVPARWPKPQEMRRAFRTESLAGCYYSREEMAEEILNLASDAEGLFFYIRNHQSKCYANRESPLYAKGENSGKLSELGEFWTVEDEVRELFSRLAAIEAATAIDKIDVERKPLYSSLTIVMFRVLASACACAFWFNGSWIDIFVSGVLAELVAMIGSSPILSKQERIIFEAVASFVVGFTAACIALTWPEHCCFGAMAISGVLDLLQGFRVVYSIIEIMSRHTVTGGADFLEGVFFTTLIAYCLRFGQYMALETLGYPETEEYTQCTKGVSEWWYLLFVPVGAFAWSGLFNPHYFDLPIMAAHGILGYLVSWQFYKTASNTQMNNFLAAMAVTFSAGIVSRFTGRQALGNTVAGLYVLLPGAYLVTQVYSESIDGFLWQIILRAIIIGIGGWTGTILCTPTLLGINKGLMEYSKAVPTLIENGSVSDNMSSASSIASGQNFRRRDKSVRKNGTGALLFF